MKHLFRLLALTVCLSAFVIPHSSFASDLSITATNVKPGANAIIRRDWTAGEAITAGQLVYRSSSDFKVYKADSDSGTAAVRDCIGFALNSAALGAPVFVDIEDDDLTIGATVANGTVYILSATAGGIAPLADATTGWYVTVVCVGKSTTKVAFRAKPIRSATAL